MIVTYCGKIDRHVHPTASYTSTRNQFAALQFGKRVAGNIEGDFSELEADECRSVGRSGADTEASGDHFVHVAIDEQGEDFPVTRRQPFKASFSLITLGGLLRNRLATRECFIKNLKQGSGSSGFSMKCRRRRAWPRQF